MTTPKDELSEAIRESVAQLRMIVRQGSDHARLSAASQLISFASQYPTLAEVFGDPDSQGDECDNCESLRDELEAAQEESVCESRRADAAEKAFAPLRERLTAFEFDAKQSQEAVDDAFKTVHRWLDQCGAPRDAVETEDGDKTELSLQKRIEWLGRGVNINASLLKYAIRWRSDWPSDRSKDHPDWVECNATIEAMMSGDSVSVRNFDAGGVDHGDGGRTIADRVNNLVKRRDEEEARLKGLLATAPAELSQKDGELRRAYMSIGHAVHVLNGAGFVCDQENMGKAIVDMAHALVVAKCELSAVRK